MSSETLAVYCHNCGGVPEDVTLERTESNRLLVECHDCGGTEVWEGGD